MHGCCWQLDVPQPRTLSPKRFVDSSPSHSDYGNADLHLVGLEKLWALLVEISSDHFENESCSLSRGMMHGVDVVARDNTNRPVKSPISSNGLVEIKVHFGRPEVFSIATIKIDLGKMWRLRLNPLGGKMADHDRLVAFFTNEGVGDLGRWLWGGGLIRGEFIESVGNSGGLLSCWDENVFKVEHRVCSNRYILPVGTWIPLG
ncbi:hypothetical protein PTKIN_Ptkin04bG0122500 [Pterospermum kingtungense]